VHVHLEDIWVPPNRGGDCLLDDTVRLTADEALQLAQALLAAARAVIETPADGTRGLNQTRAGAG
jgi:hypothetical protein